MSQATSVAPDRRQKPKILRWLGIREMELLW